MKRAGKQPPPLAYPQAKQRDLVAEDPVSCPTCGRAWKAAKRVCRKCGQQISNNHKWQLIPAGPGLWAIEHRNCENPGSYRCEDQRRSVSFAPRSATFPTTE